MKEPSASPISVKLLTALILSHLASSTTTLRKEMASPARISGAPVVQLCMPDQDIIKL